MPFFISVSLSLRHNIICVKLVNFHMELGNIVEEKGEAQSTERRVKLKVPVTVNPNIREGKLGSIERVLWHIVGMFGPLCTVHAYDHDGNHIMITCPEFREIYSLPDEGSIPNKIMKGVLKARYGECYVYHKVSSAKFVREKKHSSNGVLNLEGTVYLSSEA